MAMGMYSPYGMGYSPYGMSGMYSSGGYYNPYDYNSVSTYNGPRTAPGGGSSNATSGPRGPMLREEAKNPNPKTLESGVSPASMERFNQVSIPKETMAKIAEERNPNPTRSNPEYHPVSTNNNMQQQINRGASYPNATNSNTGANTGRPRASEAPAQASQQQPTRWYNSGNNNLNENSAPAFIKF